MVRETGKESTKLYTCEECGLEFEERVWAERCEDYDREHNACSLEIASHAVREERIGIK